MKPAAPDALGDRPYVGDIRGRGFFIGIELVADRATKEPLSRDCSSSPRSRDQAFANGLICYPVGGNVDGMKRRSRHPRAALQRHAAPSWRRSSTSWRRA